MDRAVFERNKLVIRLRGPFVLLRRYRVIMQSDKKHFTVTAAGRQWALTTKKLAKKLVC